MKLLPKHVTLSDLQKYVEYKCVERGFGDETISQKFMLLNEELGELAKAARKDAGIKSASGAKRLQVEQEAADVLFVFINLCNKLEISLEDAFLSKEAINDTRQWK